MSSTPEGVGPGGSQLILVTGAGRSGTSTMAGLFFRLGYHVPQPMLKANESNPRGFYESTWPVKYHNRLLKRADIAPTDGRPSASATLAEVLDDRNRGELRRWLAQQLDGHPRVMVKDPRAAWVPGLWSETAAGVGAELGFVTMLRHPTEVIGSRRTHYAAEQPPDVRRTFSIRHLCGWMNQNLTVERLNRGERRAFVGYVDLLTAWRPVLATTLRDLRLPPQSPTAEQAAGIDAFIEPTLRRHATDWDSLDLPEPLVELAERTWVALTTLAGAGGRDEAAEQELDAVGEGYARLHSDASAMSWDHAHALARAARRHGVREGRRENRGRRPNPPAASPSLPRRVARRLRSLLRRRAGDR